MDPLKTPEELAREWDACFDLTSPLVFFPVRHHSPACAAHLARTLEHYRPDCILIEGPADTNHLIPHIGSGDNKAPLCIYYTSRYQDDEGGERRSACYYPLLDFSPELTAVRYGVGNGVETRFIDLPYAALSRLERQEDSTGEGKDSYYDDYYLSRSRYIARLCEKQGCRHYGELWEKLFELHGLAMDTARFVRAMLALCHYSRVEYPAALLEGEGCIARENHMAVEIAAAGKQFSRVLVVTGGFHTAALRELTGAAPKRMKLPKGNQLPLAKAEAYLIPYSFAESDQLAGYGSGMPYPAFYQGVHERMGKSAAPYNDTVMAFLAAIGGALRRGRESTSIADEVAAVAQAKGLAALRDKPQQGVYELLDGVRSAFVKADGGPAAAAMLETATRLLRGDRMGEVASGSEQVPLLLDFRATARRLRLTADRTARREVVLDILAKPAHREASAFFHRLQFLEIPFGERKFGPDYRRRDTARVREKWVYASGARVEARVIDAAYLGGTVREAASTALSRRRAEHLGCGAYTALLIDAAVMDLTEQVAPLIDAVETSVAEDGSFASLAQAAGNLLFLESAKWLLSLPDTGFAASLLGAVYRKACALLPTLDTNQEDEDRALAGTLKDLHQIARREGEDPALLQEALLELCDRQAPAPPPCLQGAAAGLLHAAGVEDADAVLRRAGTYLFGSGEEMKRSGRFLSGVFLSAWDILFQGPGFLEGLGNVLATLPREEFLTLLPDLRLAFSVFTPTQIDRISGMVAGMLGLDSGELAAPAVPEALLALGRSLDEYATERMREVPANAR